MEKILNENIQLTNVNMAAIIGFAGSGVVPSGMITFRPSTACWYDNLHLHNNFLDKKMITKY